MRSPLLLCLSRDFDLRETRHRVLRTRYHAIALGSVAAMQALPATPTIDLLVLCHTLSEADRNEAIRFARECWPDIKVLDISAPYGTYLRGQADAVVGGLAGPKAMFDAIGRLLPSSRTAQA